MKYQILHNLTDEYIEKLKARFWAKVNTSGGPDSCWEWTAGKIKQGYGKIGVKSKYQLSHRVSYELNNGPIPNNHHVLHHCDNPACINPKHLFTGTDKDNNDDMMRKGRNCPVRGRRNANAKLTPSAVHDIRANYVPGKPSGQRRQKYSIGYFSRKYDVSRPVIIRVLKHEGWTHINC